MNTKKITAVLLLSISFFAYGGSDLSPQKALGIVKAFRMGSSAKDAHVCAKQLGLKKSSTQKIDDLRVVSYGVSYFSPYRVKLIFSSNDSLTGVLMRVGSNDGPALKKWARDLEPALGSPTIHGKYSGFHAGLNFETCVYAEWSGYLLTLGVNDDKIWIERRR